MLRSLTTLAAAAVLCLAFASRADQCDYISAKQATNAEKILKQQTQFVSWCQPCGTAKGKPTAIKTIVKKPAGDPKYMTIFLNGKEIDLAYTYVRKSPSENFKNLAKLASCTTTGVLPEIKGSGLSY